MRSATPSDIEIRPRNVSFPRQASGSRWWYGGDPIATTFYNALSLSFPAGEGYFVQSVRHYLNELPEPLRTQAEEFATQEAYHSREHMAFNRQVSGAGYDTKGIEDFNRDDARKMKDEPADVNVAATAALEHFTAMLAHAILRDDRHFKDCPPDVQRLWRWHSIEEIEHKSVAYDTFLHATRDLTPFQRWSFRSLVMFKVTIDFWRERMRDLKILFQQDGLDTKRTYRRLAKFLWWSPGILRQIFIPYLTYYLPGFHPWKLDDRKLAARAERGLGLEEMTQPA